MSRFEELMQEIKKHPVKWVESGIGAEMVKEAYKCAPPEVLRLIKNSLRHNELMRQIFAKQELDPEWIHSDEARPLLAEALSVAPPGIQAQMDAKLKELNMLPTATMCDENGNAVYSLEQLAEKMGGTVEDVQRAVEEAKAHHPSAFIHTGPVHRIH